MLGQKKKKYCTYYLTYYFDSKLQCPQQQQTIGETDCCRPLLLPVTVHVQQSQGLSSLRTSFALTALLYVFSKCKQHKNNEPPRLKDILNNVSFYVGEIILFKET